MTHANIQEHHTMATVDQGLDQAVLGTCGTVGEAKRTIRAREEVVSFRARQAIARA